jgi:ribosomal-protein-alanine N-acetyltransferase
MPEMVTLRGPRVTLRPWRLPEDLDPLFAINGDPQAMRFFPKVMDRAESDAFGHRLEADFATRGFGFAPVELPGEGMVGVVGVKPVPFDAHFTPAFEIGWRIATRVQRRGIAEEAARIALAHAFGPAGLDRVFAFTPPANEPSWRLMEKLGMRPAGRFDHPGLPDGHRFRDLLLYSLDRDAWVAERFG